MTRLLADAMLGTLATYLRMCGHDVAYALDRGVEADDELAAIARAEDRRLVTRDRDLAARIPEGLLVESREVRGQLGELQDAGIELSLEAPARCGECNGALERVPGDEPTPGYAPDPVAKSVWRCPGCGQHFWKGSHWDDVAETLDAL